MNRLFLWILFVAILFAPFKVAFAISDVEKTAIAAFQGNVTALNDLAKEADKGNAEAQMWLGTLHYAKKEFKNAFHLFEKSHVKGNLQATFNLARMYDKGLGITKNIKQAKELYLMSAEKGYADSQHNIGNMYYLGDGVKKDQKEALKWLLLAAEQGQRMAQRDLGIMFADGHGVKRNYVLAYTYMSLAAINNEPSASIAAAKIKNRMTGKELKKANEFINQAKSIQSEEIREYFDKNLR